MISKAKLEKAIQLPRVSLSPIPTLSYVGKPGDSDAKMLKRSRGKSRREGESGLQSLSCVSPPLFESF